MGELIKNFRKRAALTQKELAERLLVSESLEGAYERAERIPSRDYLLRADQVLGAQGALASCVEMMEEEKYPPEFVDWVKLEADAVSIGAYESLLVPGLLQTPEYIRALYRVRVPVLEDEEIERLVDARLERQTVLSRKPLPILSFVVEQSVVERPIGGVEVLRKQLWHLFECMRNMHNVTLTVMPTRRHEHAGLRGPVALLSTAEGRNLAYAEGQGGGTLISKPEEVNLLFERYSTLRAQALTPWESVDLIERTASAL
ncbi:Scr1 family TA system antitoxin-like transcriptional regulator [Streptomyces sp. NPDC048639]|uniref:helix-turn-helix domain-containing protein n=1 Tax=Streptomyces sp. NPDC048639 TaxID=3365581 RepID=UPI003717B9C9